MAQVLFKFGSRAAYDAEVLNGSILNNALYFLEDTNELYKGIYPIGSAHYYFGIRNNDETDVNAIARILGVNTPVLNDMLVIQSAQGEKDIFLFAVGTNNEEGWQKITGNISSSNVIFSDGNTLDQKINNVSVAVDETTIVRDSQTGVLGLVNYGEEYWRWDDTTGDYVLQQVDNQHPWGSGLTPRVYDDNGTFRIGWYEPNPNTVEGITTDLTAVKQDVRALQTLVGRIGTNNDPSTGLVSRVELLEHVTGGLTYNNVTYTTIKDYVDAVAANFNIEWISMNQS